MAMKEQYYTVDGQMIGYKTAAGRKDFLTDALGSVTAEVDQTGATKTFDGRYKPYGRDLSSTGTRGSYGWVGTWGYRETGLSSSSHYVRARHYSKTNGSWTTIDPLWLAQPAFRYVRGRVTRYTDPSGLRPENYCKKFNELVYNFCIRCKGDLSCQIMCNYYASRYFHECGNSNRFGDHRGCYNWVPRPGVGIVPIPCFSPPVPPTIGSVMPTITSCESITEECIKLTDKCNGKDNTPGCEGFESDWTESMGYRLPRWPGSCHHCCAKMMPRSRIAQCAKACDEHSEHLGHGYHEHSPHDPGELEQVEAAAAAGADAARSEALGGGRR